MNTFIQIKSYYQNILKNNCMSLSPEHVVFKKLFKIISIYIDHDFPSPNASQILPIFLYTSFHALSQSRNKTDKQNHNKLNISKQKMKQRAPCIHTNKL